MFEGLDGYGKEVDMWGFILKILSIVTKLIMWSLNL
jgi:hypothetical protein